MTPLFLVLAAALAAVTLAMLLRPLLVRRDDGARPAARSALLVATVVLVGASALYRLVGTPAALDPSTHVAASADDAQPVDLASAVQELEARMAAEPNELGGWVLLARAYRELGRLDDAVGAIERARALAPDDPEVLVDYAETRAQRAADKRFDADAEAALDHALQVQPGLPRALLLKGVVLYQRAAYAEAAEAWTRVEAGLAPENTARAALAERIEDARQRAGLPPRTLTAQAPADAATAAAPLRVRIELDPALAAAIGPEAALFVVVRTAGQPRPLAAKRLPPDGFPLEITLSDADAMLPGTRLAESGPLELLARISQSGAANAAAGDLEAPATPAAADGATTTLRITTVRP